MTVWRDRVVLLVAAMLVSVGSVSAASRTQQTDLTADALAGIWQFETPMCGSSYGMGLYRDGTAWLDEPFGGTWQLTGTTLRFVVDEYDPGQDKPLQTDIVIEATILAFSGDALRLRWLETGQEIDAYRCPDP